MNAYISCVGCEQRGLDSQRLLNYLTQNNVYISQSPENSDYVFVITCGVDSFNEQQSVKEIRDLSSRMCDGSKLLVGGCLPSISPESLADFDIYHSFSPTSLESLDSVLGLGGSVSEINIPNNSINDTEFNEKELSSARDKFEMAKAGYKVKVAEGCLGACTYCMIKEATGNLISSPVLDIISQVEEGSAIGKPTIMLMAGDTGAYGRDIGTSFNNLLAKINYVEGEFKLYVHDFGVNWLIDDLPNYLDVFNLGESKGRFGGITFPIQSGSDKVLELMGRNYSSRETIDALKQLRDFSFDIGTHVMFGFPGENNRDFEDTLNLLDEVNFDFITCFAYSENPRAKSSNLPNKVPAQIVKSRLDLAKKTFRDKLKVIA